MADPLSSKDFRKLVEKHPKAVMVTTPEPRIRYVNKAFTTVTGFSAEEVIDRKPSVLSSGFHGRPFYINLWESLSAHGEWEGLIWNRRRCGELYPQWLSIRQVSLSGELHYMGQFQDVGHPDRLQTQEAALAHYDALTQLPNRYLFRSFLEARINRNANYRTPFGLLFVDIDHFKHANDLHGHRFGDLLIAGVASRLQSLVGSGDRVSRLAGDEFCLIVEAADTASLVHCCRSLVESFQSPLVVEETDIFVSLSIGATLFPQHGVTVDHLMKKADQAMYAAKEAGRACFRLFDAELAAKTERREVIAANLLYSLRQEHWRFSTVYQPILELKGENVVGIETLLRWTDPVYGSILPSEFIAIAEDRHWMKLLTEVLITTILHDLSQWSTLTGKGLLFSINISAQLLNDKELTYLIVPLQQALFSRGHSLVLEITETQMADLSAKSFRGLESLMDSGIRFAIDDFGTGYSSLAYLQQLPVDIIKLDRCFVEALDQGSRRAARTARAVLTMTLSLDLTVIAEGIETPEQQQALINMNGTLGQGFLLGRPAPWSDIEKLI